MNVQKVTRPKKCQDLKKKQLFKQLNIKIHISVREKHRQQIMCGHGTWCFLCYPRPHFAAIGVPWVLTGTPPMCIDAHGGIKAKPPGEYKVIAEGKPRNQSNCRLKVFDLRNSTEWNQSTDSRDAENVRNLREGHTFLAIFNY